MTEAEKLLLDAACGSEEAHKFLVLWCSYCHAYDDLLDGDTAPTALAYSNVEGLLARLLSCPFYEKHSEIILLLRCLISEEHTASESWRKKEGRAGQWGLEMSHCGNDMIRLVALICGGEEGLKKISEALRELTLKEHYGNEYH